MDLPQISRLLRKLNPRQEKVVRLFFGLGCQRPRSAREVAQEFGVSVQVIAGLLGAAQRRLTSSQLRQAARGEADLRRSSGLVLEARSTVDQSHLSTFRLQGISDRRAANSDRLGCFREPAHQQSENAALGGDAVLRAAAADRTWRVQFGTTKPTCCRRISLLTPGCWEGAGSNR